MRERVLRFTVALHADSVGRDLTVRAADAEVDYRQRDQAAPARAVLCLPRRVKQEGDCVSTQRPSRFAGGTAAGHRSG